MRYDFESLNELTNPEVIFCGIVGSRAYGTANAQSDTDTRGIFHVPAREYVRLAPPPSQVADAHNDHAFYSLLRFCELMSEANPTTLEMLYLPDECVLKRTPAFDLLQENRDIFITQMAVDSHLGYAVSQVKKARGCNKRVVNPMPEDPPCAEEHCHHFVGDAHRPPVPLAESGVDLRTCKVTGLTRNGSTDMFALYDFGADTGGVFRGGQPVVSVVTSQDADKRIGILVFNRQSFECAKRRHKEYWEWRRCRNETRWISQERGEIDYDAKNMMHLMRLLYSGENIVRNGSPIVRFEGKRLETLLSIRRGEWAFDNILAESQRLQAEIEAQKGRLPIAPDKAKIDALISEIMDWEEKSHA